MTTIAVLDGRKGHDTAVPVTTIDVSHIGYVVCQIVSPGLPGSLLVVVVTVVCEGQRFSCW